jgi:hypothetical protein
MNDRDYFALAHRLGRSRLVQAAWWALILINTVTGLVVGYFPLWLDLGSDPGRSDYTISAGGYGAGGVVLAVGALGLTGLGGPRLAAWAAGVGALVLALFAASSARSAAAIEPDTYPTSFWEGSGAVLLTPWCWVLLSAGALGVYYRVRRS